MRVPRRQRNIASSTGGASPFEEVRADDDEVADETDDGAAEFESAEGDGGAALSAGPFGQLDDDLAARMRPSKTQLKKQMHELQALGEALVSLPVNRITPLDLPDSLLEALRDYRQTKTHEGRRRQMQYIGKLMRHTDPEPIREAVASMQLGSAKETLALHDAERWRVELIASDDALTRWLEDHPETDVQQIRSLIRAARKDAAAKPEQRNGRAYRELFQLIKQHQAAGASNEADGVDEPADDDRA